MTLWFCAFPAALPHRASGSFAPLPRPRDWSSGGAPKGFTVPACTMDLRAGGTWHTVMRSPEGKDHIVSGVYREIIPPERLVFTWGWEEDGARGHETLVTIELLEAPGGTRLELTHEVFETEEQRDRHRHGWSGCFDCLEQALAEGAIE